MVFIVDISGWIIYYFVYFIIMNYFIMDIVIFIK